MALADVKGALAVGGAGLASKAGEPAADRQPAALHGKF